MVSFTMPVTQVPLMVKNVQKTINVCYCQMGDYTWAISVVLYIRVIFWVVIIITVMQVVMNRYEAQGNILTNYKTW